MLCQLTTLLQITSCRVFWGQVGLQIHSVSHNHNLITSGARMSRQLWLCADQFETSPPPPPPRPLDAHCSKPLERVVSFNFAAMAFTPLLKKWPHLNRLWGPGEGNLTAENQKSQMPGGLPGGGMLMFQIDRRITAEMRPTSLQRITEAARSSTQKSIQTSGLCSWHSAYVNNGDNWEYLR